MDGKLLWIWLTTLDGISSAKIAALLECFDTIEDIYNADEAALLRAGKITRADAQRIAAHDLTLAKQILERIGKIGAWILTYEDTLYPGMLRECLDIPYVIYGMGEILPWERILAITVVGTRDATDYGLKVTEQIAYDLAQNGVVIVGGMARGIDTAAHKAALDAGGKTVAVLGCGIDVIYPAENRKLYAQIIKHGAVITEFAPGTRAHAANFPRRNRIMASLSAGTLVTESPQKSGSRITARLALEMGKDVFAVPGDYNRYFSQGCNDLIQSGGAKLCKTVEDILEEYSYQLLQLHGEGYKIRKGKPLLKKKPETEKKVLLSQAQLEGLDTQSRALVGLLAQRNMHTDELCKALGCDAAEVATKLTMLEISGVVRHLGSNIFTIQI